MASNVNVRIKAVASVAIKEKLPGGLLRQLVLPIPSEAGIDIGIEESVFETRNQLGQRVVESVTVEANQPTFTLTFPGATPELIALRTGQKISSGTINVTLDKRFKVTQSNKTAAGAAAGVEGNGMPADQAGSIGSYLSDDGVSIPLTRVDTGSFNAAGVTSFSQGANGAYQLTDDLVGREVHLSFPISLANRISLSEQPFLEFTMDLLFLQNDMRLVKLVSPAVSPVLSEGDFSLGGSDGFPITFRSISDGTSCKLWDIYWLNQIRTC